MSYLVIARRFRPAQFQDVVGQEVVTRTLQNALRLERVAHAYLFSGTRGVGKTTTARLLAKSLNCAAGIAPEPCGTCASCTEIAAGSSLDVLEIDGASNRGINEVRELRESARYAPARDRHKIFIIDEVHMLTSEAFNALLKTLEEPPRHVIFIMATTERDKLPPTILSRCQKFDFRRLGLDEIRGSLAATCKAMSVAADEPALEALARAADGSVRDAQSLLEQVIAYAGDTVAAADVDIVLGNVPRQLVLQALEAVIASDSAAVLLVVADLYESGQDPRLFVARLLAEYRNLILLSASAAAGGALTPEDAERLAPLARQRTLPELLTSAEVLARLDRELRFATMPRFNLEVGLLELAEMPRMVALAELLTSPPSSPSPPRGGGPTSPRGSSTNRSGPAPTRGSSRATEAAAPPQTSRPAALDIPSVSAPTTAANAPASEGPVAAFLDDARTALGLRAGFLDEVIAVAPEKGALVVKLSPQGETAAQILSAPEVIALLEQSAVPHFGAGLRVAIHLASAAESATVSAPAAATRTTRADSQRPSRGNGGTAKLPPEVERSPLVKRLIDIFQGDVAHVENPTDPGAN